jgi:ABC-type uncharacterized transport system permease subunit
MTIIALAATSTSWGRIRTPAALGVPYTREDN